MAKKKYHTGKSKIQGKGAFANENLKPGDYIGKVHTINQLYTDYDFTDLGRNHNHSNNPNVQNVLIGNERHLVATKPIKKGQELTSNYRLQPDLEQPEDFEEAKSGWLDQYEDGGTAESRMGGLTDIPFNYNSAWGGQFQSGGSLPGSVGFTYARTKGIPSEGPYAKKTMPSAQNGKYVSDNTRVSRPIDTRFIERDGLREVESFEPQDTRPFMSDSRAKERGDVLWNAAKKLTAAGQFVPVPVVRYPSIALNSAMGATDAAFSYGEGDMINAKINAVGAIPLPGYGSIKALRSAPGLNTRQKASVARTALGALGIDLFGASADLTDNFEMEKRKNGGNMTYYQHGLDFKPKTISQDGRSVKKYDWQVDPRSPLATESTAIRFGPSTTATSGMSRQEMAENAESMRRAKAVENYEKKARVDERKAAVAAKDKGEKFTLPTGETKRYEDMDAREKMYVSGRALGQRGRLNESDETFFDEWINPLNYIGGMAESLGTAPYEAKLYDSNLPYVGAAIDPLIGGLSSRLRLKGKGVSPSGVREASPKPPVSAEELFDGPINITPVGQKVMDKELSSHVDAARIIAEYGRPRLPPSLDALNPRPKDVRKLMAEIAMANNPSTQMYHRGKDLGEKLEEFVPFPKSRLYDRKDFYHILRPNKDGGLVKAQGGTFIPKPTETDSLNLFNHQIALNKFYDNEVRAGRLRVADVHPAFMVNLNVLQDDNLKFYRKEVEHRKHMEDRNQSTEGVWDDEYKKFFNLTSAQVKKLELQGIGRTKSGNEYQQYYRDLITPLQNLAAPFAMVDSRIKPQREIKYESSDRSGDTPYPGGDVLVYDYDPIVIKPDRLLTPEERKKRNQLTKTKPIPTKPKPKPPLKAKEKEKEKQPEVPKMTRRDIEQPIASTAKQIKEQINYNQGTPVYAPTPGGGSAGSFVGFKDKSGKVTYVQSEDYERMGVPKYGREYIEKNIQKKRSGGWLSKYE